MLLAAAMVASLALDPLPFPDVHKYLPSPMPSLGRPSRALFTFEDGWTNLNHGSYGAPARAVQMVQRNWMDVMESNPEEFIRWRQYAAIDHVRFRLAEYIGADVDDVVLIDNASHGMNAVLRSLAERLAHDALVLDLSLAYTMVKNTLSYLETVFGHRVITANLTLAELATPGQLVSDDAIIAAVQHQLVAHSGAIKLVSVSHITSTPAIVLPLARLARLAHQHGALIVADGAHCLGQLPLDVPNLGVDFYVTNGAARAPRLAWKPRLDSTWNSRDRTRAQLRGT